MFGFALLIISILLYFSAKYRYLSYLIYLSFMLGYGGGFGLTTDSIIGVKNTDMAIVYTIVISIYLLLKRRYVLPNIKFTVWYKSFIIFLICTAVFSYIYYKFSILQILQGGRGFLLIASLPILIKITSSELSKLFPILLWVTAVTSVLYILQVVFARPLMPYSVEVHMDQIGLVRMYNSPALLSFFLSFSFVCPEYFGGKVNLFRLIFVAALICTLGRTQIIASIMVVMLSLLFQGKSSKVFKAFILLGVLFIPFSGLIIDRFSDGGTRDDLLAVSQGAYHDYRYGGEGGTMTYRIAWVYERADYLVNRPILEQVFGLGMISDSQNEVNNMYHFKLGLRNPETNLPFQLTTPDTAYGNLITRLGFGGSILYLGFLISLAMFFFKHRKENVLFIVGAAEIIMLFVLSFSGSVLSEPKNLAIYFIVLSTLLNKRQSSQLANKEDLLLYSSINN